MGPSRDEVYGPVYQAHHEAGHAAGYLAQGIPLSYVTINGSGPQLRPHTQPVDLQAGTRGQKVLAYTSGVIAGFDFNGWRLSDHGVAQLLCGSVDGNFQLVSSRGRTMMLPRAPLVAFREDLWLVSPEFAQPPFTPERAVAFWRDCEKFVLTARPGINAVAAGLAATGHLVGQDAQHLYTEGMRGQYDPWLPAWTAER